MPIHGNRTLTTQDHATTSTATLIACATIASLTFGACDDGPTPSDATGGVQPSISTLYGPDITEIVLEVDYAVGAEPFVEGAGTLDNPWRIFGDNAERMFAAAGDKTLTFPDSLDEMEALTDVSGESFNGEDILAIAQRHRDEKNTDSRATFYAVWLDGFFRDNDGEVRQNVLGVSLGDTGVIAMFKPVIAGGGPSPLLSGVDRFVEQTTLVHELGHAAGLVNRGVPLTSDHHDEENGAHCTNQDCVMFFANEGVADLRDFVVKIFTTGDTIVFADDCLDDMDTLIESQR